MREIFKSFTNRGNSQNGHSRKKMSPTSCQTQVDWNLINYQGRSLLIAAAWISNVVVSVLTVFLKEPGD